MLAAEAGKAGGGRTFEDRQGAVGSQVRGRRGLALGWALVRFADAELLMRGLALPAFYRNACRGLEGAG